MINQSKQILRNKNPDDLEYLPAYVVGSGSHVQYYHARQLKLLCGKYRTITQPRAKKKKDKKSARRNLVHGATDDSSSQCYLFFFYFSANVQPQPRSQNLSSYCPLGRAPGDGKMRDPGNEVGINLKQILGIKTQMIWNTCLTMSLAVGAKCSIIMLGN